MSKLFIIATPIGNLADISLRAISQLRTANLIICENVLKSTFLLEHHNIRGPKITSYSDKSSQKERSRLIEKILEHEITCIISDAGTPLISDPGYKLVEECLQNNIEVDVIPGATALIAALVVSGMPTDQFMFMGFIPSTLENQKAKIESFALYESVIVLYEAPKKILALLRAIARQYAGIRVSVSKELTKMYQKTYNGAIEDVLAEIESDGARGEYVVVLDKIHKEFVEQDIIEEYKIFHSLKTKDLAKFIERKEKISKNDSYAISLKIKNQEV